ncbi:AraC family transcriptional regulator [Sphingobium boeckii]|uniref:AraC-like DNA-binding protein n=1 Tax=Sphingobium boeckii TaxID=1082345 RepID=A0A7W9AIM3_9SPHN|nr:AraC family transcriptional regulator [Sphingobium boeckii]MBB5686340.1 AraC-like DNA-binding protein [Sphingobium boeckii]
MIGKQLSKVPDYQLFVSDDVEDMRDRISAVMQPHDLRPLGLSRSVSCSMSYLQLANIGVGTISFGRMAVHLDRIDGYHLLILCQSGQAEIRIGQETLVIGGSKGVCIGPGEAFSAEFSHDCVQLIFRIDDLALRRASGRSDATLRNVFDLGSAELRSWVKCADMVLDDRAMMALMQSDRNLSASYEQVFLTALFSGLGVIGEPKCGTFAPAAVKRAEAYIEENIRNEIALGDIASAVGVPVRTLLDSFQRFRGISPMRYLRDRRLDEARDRLRCDPNLRVTQVALESGFTHLGRFSQAYRLRFGERPSLRSGTIARRNS